MVAIGSSLSPPKDYTSVRIKMGGYFVMEGKRSDDPKNYPVYGQVSRDVNPPHKSSIFYVEWSKLHTGTKIINAESNKLMCSRSGRWSIYAMTEQEQGDLKKKLWFMHGDILKNVDDNNGVHWEMNDHYMLMREKKSDSSCDAVEIVPYVDESKVTIEETKDLRWIVRNMTSGSTKNIISKTIEETLKTEVFRERFNSVSANVTFEGHNKTKTPTTNSKVAFKTELGLKATWTDKGTKVTEKKVKVEQGQVELQPMTGKALEKITWTYRLEDEIVLMVEQHASEIIVKIDDKGNRV